MTKTNRNAPCPCGSGKKYKACHGTADKTRAGTKRSRMLAIIVGIVVIGGAAIAFNTFRTTDLSESGVVYDAANDRYWDPTHGHWHDGKPPADVADSHAARGDLPQPYEYDPETNHYWDPAHQHWHEGMPPLSETTNPPEQQVPQIQGGTDVRALSAEEAAAKLASGEATQVQMEEVGLGPKPWEYDADNDRHWNPDTKTWEQGMPPLDAFESNSN